MVGSTVRCGLERLKFSQVKFLCNCPFGNMDPYESILINPNPQELAFYISVSSKAGTVFCLDLQSLVVSAWGS